MAGPIGPPGFNGTQGPTGPAGPAGAPGPKGAGDFSACQYKQVTGPMTPGSSVATANLAEPKVSLHIKYNHIMQGCLKRLGQMKKKVQNKVK